MSVQQSSDWFNCRFPRPEAACRLLCFPWSGGGSAFYSNWGQLFPNEIEVVGIRLPGRESRRNEDGIDDLSSLTEQVVNEILRLCNDKPFAFFGHSMGVVTSFEAACYLREKHSKDLLHLFLSGTFAPHSQNRKKNRDDKHRERWCTLPDSELIKKVESLGGTPRALLEDYEFMTSIFLPPFRADLTAVDGYFYEKSEGYTPLTCPLTVFDGAEDNPHNIQEYADLTAGPFKSQLFPGKHFYLYNTENSISMAHHVSKALLNSLK